MNDAEIEKGLNEGIAATSSTNPARRDFSVDAGRLFEYCRHVFGLQKHECRICLISALAAAYEAGRADARAQKDSAYRERDQVVALAARMAAILRWPTWLARHEDKPGDPPWEDNWRNIVFIRLPSGQVSWHIHDSEVSLVRFLPSALSSEAEPWDGHDTAEKYRRCGAPWLMAPPGKEG